MSIKHLKLDYKPIAMQKFLKINSDYESLQK